MEVDDEEPVGTEVLWRTRAKPAYSIWVGRRHLRREKKRENPDLSEFELELEVSKKIADDQVKSGARASGISFLVELKQMCGAYHLGFSDIYSLTEFYTFFSFLTSFIPKLIRSMTVVGQNGN